MVKNCDKLNWSLPVAGAEFWQVKFQLCFTKFTNVFHHKNFVQYGMVDMRDHFVNYEVTLFKLEMLL